MSCPTGKDVFATKADAVRMLRDRAKRGRTISSSNLPAGMPKVIAYKCDLCKAWHVGHGHGVKPRPMWKERIIDEIDSTLDT